MTTRWHCCNYHNSLPASTVLQDTARGVRILRRAEVQAKHKRRRTLHKHALTADVSALATQSFEDARSFVDTLKWNEEGLVAVIVQVGVVTVLALSPRRNSAL